jgi:hypothetical protein
MRSYLEKNPSQKRAGGMAQGIGPKSKPQYHKKKKKKSYINSTPNPGFHWKYIHRYLCIYI